MYHEIDTIVFDLGGVLIDWNPTYLYDKIFSDKKEMDYFLSEVCTMDWNEQQDGGRSWAEATNLLIKDYPQYTNEIKAYYERWEEMLGGPISPTVDLLEKLYHEKKYPLYALTNWSAETFPIAQRRYQFLNYFKGILVSGQVKLKKPDPKIYQMLRTRFGVNPFKTLFIDDNVRNIEAARAVGFHTIHFVGSEELEEAFMDLELLDFAG